MRRLLGLLAGLSLASPASAAWLEARSAHFIIYSEGKPEQLQQFATELERFDATMRVLRKMEPREDSPNNRLTIFLVSTDATVRSFYGAQATSLAGFYQGRAGESYAFVPRVTGDRYFTSKLVLLHEYSHHFMFRNFAAAYPGWFSEGFAEFSASARFNADGSVDIGMPARHRSFELGMMQNVPVRAMFEGKAPGMAVYSRGWLLTHYLTFSPTRKGQLDAYLRAINAGKSSLAAAEQEFGDLDALNVELNKYLRTPRMSYMNLAADKLKIGPIEVRALSAGADEMMPIFMRSRRGVDKKGAEKLVPKARKVAADYPNDAFVQLALAEAEIDAGNLAEADAAAERVLAVDPSSVRALVFRGRVALERVKGDAKSTEADWKAARRWFVRANRLEPGAPQPLLWFYRSHVEEGGTSPDIAFDGLRSAVLLAPEDMPLRMNVAVQLLGKGSTDEARVLLAPLAYDPHGGEVAKVAGTIVEAIDRGDDVQALVKLANEAPSEKSGSDGASED